MMKKLINEIQNNLINQKILFKTFFIIFIILLLLSCTIIKRYFEKAKVKVNSKKKKIGILSLSHNLNVGNMILKYAIAIKLKELGFDPYIIGQKKNNTNISFLSQFINIRITSDFSDIKPNYYDILMVNSDQTWRIDFINPNIAFLKFAKNWNIRKFVYGASIGKNSWPIPSNIKEEAKILLKNFSAISVREKGTIPLIEKYLGIKPLWVLDPTLLIDKSYYLHLIKNYKSDFDNKKKYICNYILNSDNYMKNFLNKSSEKLNYTIVVHNATTKRDDFIQRFLLCIYYSQAVITNSYHGTIFSIIFNKPFIVYQISNDDERLNNLDEILDIRNRIIKMNENPNISLLITPLNINFDKLNIMRNISNNFLKNQLYF